MNKKAVITTILVAQLIFLVLGIMSTLQLEKETFAQTSQFQRIAAYKISTLYYDVSNDVSNLNAINAENETMQTYLALVNSSVPSYFGLAIDINTSYLALYDENLDLVKEGKI